MYNREIKIHVLRQTADVNLYHVTKFSTYSPFSLYCFYTKISSFMPDITIGIVWDCFYLLIFYSEKFSTWVWRLQFAVNVNLNLSNVGRSRVNVNVEPRSTFTLTRGLSYIASISFTYVNYTCVRTEKITRQWKSILRVVCTPLDPCMYCCPWVIVSIVIRLQGQWLFYRLVEILDAKKHSFALAFHSPSQWSLKRKETA